MSYRKALDVVNDYDIVSVNLINSNKNSKSIKKSTKKKNSSILVQINYIYYLMKKNNYFNNKLMKKPL